MRPPEKTDKTSLYTLQTDAILAEIVLTILYVLAELAYNAHLLDVLGSPKFDQQDFTAVETAGKALAGCGFSLVFTGLLFMPRVKVLLSKINLTPIEWTRFVLIPALAFAGYQGLDLEFHHILRNLSPADKSTGVLLAEYRHFALEGALRDPGGLFARKGFQASLAGTNMVAFGFYRFDTLQQAVHREIALNTDRRGPTSEDQVWTLYHKRNETIDRAYAKIQAECQAWPERERSELKKARDKVREKVYRKYVKFYRPYRLRELGGATPPQGLTRDRFYAWYIRRQSEFHPTWPKRAVPETDWAWARYQPINKATENRLTKALEKTDRIVRRKLARAKKRLCISRRQVVIQVLRQSRVPLFPGDEKFGLTPITLNEIPLGLSKAQVQQKVRRRFAQIRKTLLVSSKTVQAYDPHFVEDADGSVYIPPISMALSVFSALINALLACGLIVLLLTKNRRGSFVLQVITMGAGLVLIVALAPKNPTPKQSWLTRGMASQKLGWKGPLWRTAFKLEPEMYAVGTRVYQLGQRVVRGPGPGR